MPQVERFLVIRDPKDEHTWLAIDVLYKVVLASFMTEKETKNFIRERIRDYNSPIVQRHKR